MIIKVEQIKSNSGKKFEIKKNNELRYRGDIPHHKSFSTSFDTNKIGQCIIKDIDESFNYMTSCNAENRSNYIKWIFTRKCKKEIYDIIDNENKYYGKFYELKNGFLDTKNIIEYGDYTLKCYDIFLGKTQNISIYNNDIQIAEIISPLDIPNNLIYYYIFLLDDYSNLEIILSLFTIFFNYQTSTYGEDAQFYNRELRTEYSFSKNNKFYNKDWLTNHFDKEEINLLYNQVLDNRQKNVNILKKRFKYALLSAMIVLMILLIIVLYILKIEGIF